MCRNNKIILTLLCSVLIFPAISFSAPIKTERKLLSELEIQGKADAIAIKDPVSKSVANYQIPFVHDSEPNSHRPSKDSFNELSRRWHPAKDMASPIVRVFVVKEGVLAGIFETSGNKKCDLDALALVHSISLTVFPPLRNGENAEFDIDMRLFLVQREIETIFLTISSI